MTQDELFSHCARHADAPAGFRCIECGELLCQQCVEVGSHLIFCGICGERAIELDEWERPQPALAGPTARADASRRLDEIRAEVAEASRVPPTSASSTTGVPPTSASSTAGVPPTSVSSTAGVPPTSVSTTGVPPDTATRQSSTPRSTRIGKLETTERLTYAGPAVFFVNHVVIPVATLTMVTALLFFLLDVRSVYLVGTEALKWVGFCFVSATVLIARYGRASADAERQGCYTLALAGATVVAMTVSPWANPSGGYSGTVVNLLIILVVWRFATRLTQSLSFEGVRFKDPEPRLFGTERLQLEKWQSEASEGATDEGATNEEKTRSDSKNPVAPVARLAAAGLLAFALGEPFLLAGPPTAGERALGAMIVFLLAGSVVLAAASGLGTLRRVRALGGQASLRMLPGRVAAAGIAMTLLAALALALPGTDVRGTGELRPASPNSGAEGGDSGQTQGDSNDTEQPESTADSQDRTPSNDSRAEPSAQQTQGPSGAAASLVGQMAELGKWLRYLVIVLAALFALWGLWWFLNHLGSASAWLTRTLSGLLQSLRASVNSFLQRLGSGLGRLFGRRTKKQKKTLIDPFADQGALSRLEPREAIVAAYGRLLAAFELLEHPRPERQTPYEFLASIPGRLRRLVDPARDLTDVYVQAVYSGSSVDAADRKRALDALEETRLHVTQWQAEK